MEVVNKKLVLVVVLIGIISSIFIWQNISDKETKLEMVSLNNETKSSSMFAIMLEQIDEEGNSTYVESSDNMWPSLKYRYNTTNSGCLDVNGTSIPDILSYDSKGQKAIVRTKKVAYCYLYFDIDESVYAKVRNDYTDNNGALLLSETESDEYPVYYYSGNITNNNVLYANFCWKMVRTTETGGVKLIYNGVPDETEDGTLTCDNTGEESQIGTSIFNPNTSLAYVGYMYNNAYKVNRKNMFTTTKILKDHWTPGAYYYGDTIIWDGEKYILSNIDGSDVTTYAWNDNYNNLVGKYTCKSETDTRCKIVSYVASSSSYYMHYYDLDNGKDYDDYKIKLATSVMDNGNGTFNLVNPVEIIIAEYSKNNSNYKGYYYCSDLTNEVCSDIYIALSTNSTSISGNNLTIYYKYGSSFKYENGVYKLVDTKEFWNWEENYNTLNSNHYTCLNTSGTCELVYYIYYTDNDEIFYITLDNGKSVEEAVNEMLYAEDVNKTDSTIKNYIDTWYENNIVGKTNSNGILYSTYLENTIWCNNREISDLGGWNPNGGSTSTNLYFNYNSLECKNKTDQFTLKVEAGGTEGYGNNALDYPIGLLTYKETNIVSSYGYLKSGNDYWFLSSSHFDFIYSYVFSLRGAGGLNNTFFYGSTSISKGVRPSVSLSNGVEILYGNGEVDRPYQIILATN